MSFITKIFGDPNARVIDSLGGIVEDINMREAETMALSDDDLKVRSLALKARLPGPETGSDPEHKGVPPVMAEALEAILPEAFALGREAARRVLGQRHYDVQLIGGIVLHRGQIAEMRTGEGKTLVATLPLYLNALAGRGAHLITVNDYLARLGAGWMGPVFHRLGLSTGVIVHDTAYRYDPEYADETQYDPRLRNFRPVGRQEAYGADIVYGTNNEFGFDYLRDNMVSEQGEMVQRELFYAIVDEVDSILIDEARTPLIISAPAEESTDRYFKFAQLVARLSENEDYNVDEKMRASTLTEAGIAKLEKWLNIDNIYTAGGVREVHHIEQALRAHALFRRDRDYVVKDGEIIIVDEFTGRLMHGRRYSEGLHQAIEAKEGVKVQRESQTLATITFQNLFRIYRKLSGMTGTAVTEAEEFSKIYGLETVVVPTHKPMVRADLNDLIYRTEAGKYKAVVEEVKRRTATGQPVLIGTISIEKNEALALELEREGIATAVLNAKQHDKEARIISDAGRPGTVTLATNMAGRGVDIMLGGHEPYYQKDKAGQPLDPEGGEYAAWRTWKEDHDRVISLGGLHVIGTERHESRRIDNQLRGRAGRQGDPGSSLFYLSAEDDLMRIFGGDRLKGLMKTLSLPEDMPIENKLVSRSIESAQRRVEGHNFDIRKHLVEYDDVVNKHREAIYRRRREVLAIAARAAQAGPPAEGGRTLTDIILGYVEKEVMKIVSFHTAADDQTVWNWREIDENVATIFSPKAKIADRFVAGRSGDKLDKASLRTEAIEGIMAEARGAYGEIAEQAGQAGLRWERIEKNVLLRSIDALWIEHLEVMSSLRQGIGLRGYGQRDPLVEYKKEAYQLFHQLQDIIESEVVHNIYKVGLASAAAAAAMESEGLLKRARIFSAPAKEMASTKSAIASLQNSDAGAKSEAAVKSKPRDAEGEKIGRNDPCPCGSGLKYKKCHGR